MVYARIAIDRQVMSGKPVIHGTRIPVELILRMVGQGISDEDILREYPRLVREDILAAVSYAADVVAGEDVFTIPAV
jgi:uncharacterized protein (DUF433 family)